MTLTRKELYSLVWSKPMTELAKEFNTSHVGLTLTCRRHHIPTPSMSYWAKVLHKQRVWKPTLTEYGGGESNAIEIDTHKIDVEEKFAEVQKQFQELHARIVNSQLPELSKHPHRLLENASISAGDKSSARAKHIMNSLLHLFEFFGFTVSIRAGNQPGTYVEILGEGIRVSLTEKLKQLDNPDRKNDWDSKHIQVPSGVLCFSICDVFFESIQVNWMDNKSSLLEGRYVDICDGLVEAAFRECIHRLDLEERERAMLEEERIRSEKEQVTKQEEARKEKLIRDSGSWQVSQMIRSYVDAATSPAVCLLNGLCGH